MDVNDLNKLGRRIRGVLKASKEPMTVEQIASKLGASKYDVYESISISLHGWVLMKDSKFSLL